MKRTAIVLLILAVVTLLMGCSADDIMNSGKTLQKLQGVNASYAAGPKLKEAETAVAKAIDVMIGDNKVVLPDVPSDPAIKLADNPEIKDKLRPSLSALVNAVQSAKESGIKRSELEALFAEKIYDNPGAWQGESYSNGKFFFIPLSMIAGYGIPIAVDFNVVLAGGVDFASKIFVNYAYLAIYNSAAVQSLIAEGGGGELPPSINELKKIFSDEVFKVSEAHLKSGEGSAEPGYLTYGDVVFTAVLADIFVSAVDILRTYEELDVSILETQEAANILSYFDLIEYLYDVDLNILQRFADLI